MAKNKDEVKNFHNMGEQQGDSTIFVSVVQEYPCSIVLLMPELGF
jgi:hypothetical protein